MGIINFRCILIPRPVATFSTPWGNLRPKRLISGARASQDLFDEMMHRIFGDIPYCMNQRDDILIGGRNIEEHNKTLQAVLQRVVDVGITFNREKCEFGVDEIDFYGYRFTKDRLKPTTEKVKAVKDSKRPETKEVVKSFLGMVGYLSKFTDRYSSITAPLRKLTERKVTGYRRACFRIEEVDCNESIISAGNDWHQEKIQSNRKRCSSSEMG